MAKLFDDDTKAFIADETSGKVIDRETGATYNSYADFQAGYEKRHQEDSNNLFNKIAQLGSMTWNSVFGDGRQQNTNLQIQSIMQSNSAMANLWTGNTPYDPQEVWEQAKAKSVADLNNISTNVSTTFDVMASNARALANASSADVSQAGEYMRANGINPSSVIDMPDDVKQQVLTQAKVANNSPEWLSFIQQHQALANWLKDPYNYARVKDDIKPQSVISSMLQSGARGALVEDLRNERGELYWQMANGAELNEQQQARIRILNSMIAKLDPEKAGRSQSILDLGAQTLGGLSVPLGRAIEGAVLGGGTGAIAGTTILPGVGTVGAAVAGASIGAQASFLHSMGVKEGGNYFGDVYEKTGKKPSIAGAVRAGVSVFTNGFALRNAGFAYDMAKKSGILEMMAQRALPDIVWNFSTGAGEYIADEELRKVYGIGNTRTYGEELMNATINGGANVLFGELIKTPAYGFAAIRLLRDKLNEGALMKRGDVDTQAELINAQVAGTSLADVQVPAEVITRYQTRPEVTEQDKADLQRIVPNAATLDRANQTGEYINIDLGSFTTVNEDFLNYMLKDARINNIRSLQEYQDAVDYILGARKGATQDAQARNDAYKSEGSPQLVDSGKTDSEGNKLYFAQIPTEETPIDNANGIYNLLTEAGNKEERRADAQTRFDNNHDTKPDKVAVQKEIDEGLQDLDNQLDQNPLYQAEKALDESKSLPSFSLTLFGKKGHPADTREWARQHLEGFDDDRQQAEVNQIAADYGFSSGAELINALAKAPTRSELRAQVVRRVTDAMDFTTGSTAERALDRLMERVSHTTELLDDFAHNRHNDYAYAMDAIKKAETKATSEIRRLQELAKRYQEVNGAKITSLDENGNPLKQGAVKSDGRIDILNRKIEEIKRTTQEKIDKIKSEYQEKLQKKVDKVKASGDKKLQKTTEKYEKKVDKLTNKVHTLQDERKNQLAYARQKRFEKRSAREGTLTIKQAREQARRILENTSLDRIMNRNSLISAAQRASRKANRAYEIGDYYEAINQSNKVLSSLAYLRESYGIIKEKTRIDMKVAKLARKQKEAWKTEENYAQVERLLYIAGIKDSYQYPAGTSLTEHMRNLGMLTGRADSIPDSIAGVIDLGYNNRFPVGQMTLYQYKDFNRTLNSLYQLGKETKAYYDNKRKETVAGLVREQVDTIKAHRGVGTGNRFDLTAQAPDRNRGMINKTKNFIEQYTNPDTFIVRMEGEHGALAKFWIDELNNRATIKSRLSHDAIEQIRSIKAKYSKAELRKNSNKNIFIEDMGVTVSKDDLIGLALSAGSEHNWRKMFSITPDADGNPSPNIPIQFRQTRKWNEDSVLDMLGQYLDKRDWETVQGYWKIFDDLWNNHAKPLEKQRKHFTPEEAPKHSFSVKLKDGTTINLKGGFFPLQEDARAKFLRQGNPRSDEQEADITLADMNFNSTTSYGTDQSQYKTRTNKNYIVDLNYNAIIPSYLDKVTTDIAFRDWWYTANNIIKNPEFKSAVVSRYGDAGLGVFQKMLNDVSKFRTKEAFTDLGVGILDFVRQTNALSVISSPTVILQGLANPFLAVHAQPDFGVKDVIGSFIKYGAGDLWLHALSGQWSKARDFVNKNYEMSPLLRDMGQSMESEMWSLFNSVGTTRMEQFRSDTAQAATTAMRWVDNMTTQVVFRGLVDKGLQKGLSPEEAVRYAERGIRRMIPSDKRYEQSQFISARRGSWQWFVSSLASFSVNMLNRTMYTLDMGTTKRNFLMIPTYVIGCGIMMPLLTDILAFRSPWQSKDDVEADDVYKWVLSSVAGGAIGQMPLVGDAFRGILSVATDEPYYGARTPTGLLSLIETAGRTGKAVASALDEDSKTTGIDAFEAGAKLAAQATGIPQWFLNVFFNAMMIFDGADPRFTDLMRRRPYDERE